MRKLLQYISFICCLGLSGLLVGCISDDIPDGNRHPASDVGRDVNLALNVSIGNTTGMHKTRDGENSGFDFVQSDIQYELIQTLRVIIVRPDYTVEFNRLITPKDKLAAAIFNGENIDNNELKFRVSTDQGRVDDKAMTCTETKRIYLIANEASLDDFSSNSTGDGQKITDLLDGYTPAYYPTEKEKEDGKVGTHGDKLYPNTLARWIIYNNWDESGDPGTNVNDLLAKPIIDNEGSGKKYVPMTEFFDVDVVSSWRSSDKQPGTTDGDSKEDIVPVAIPEQTANLFITRNFVKFIFSASSENETFEITGIRFENLSQMEYLFPNNTVYSPAKAVNNIANREIISFTTPGAAGNQRRPYLFIPPASEPFKFVAPAEGEKADPVFYAPQLYFCETNNYDVDEENKPIYKVGVDLLFHNADGTTLPVSYESVQLTNLPYSLPRNTIVKVHFVINDRNDLKAIVTLEPYISIKLDPVFGDPQPWPGDKTEN